MTDSGDQLDSSVLYANNPDWKDVTPVKFTEDELGAVRIAANEQFFDAFSYLRAVMQNREMSNRVFALVEDCIRLNSSNYSVWQYRRDLLKALNIDLNSELRYISEVISENPKNYQVWHHRRYLVEQLGSEIIKQEMEFTASIIREEPKNYHAWQHRHWILRKFSETINVNEEMSFAIKLCGEDSRNNSAWNYHFALMERSAAFCNDELMDTVIAACKVVIGSTPDNESIWNYLSGIFDEVNPPKKLDIMTFVEEIHESTAHDKRSPYMISFLADVLLERVEKDENADISYERSKAMYSELEHVDPVRKNYWKHMQTRADNVFQKHLLRKSDNRVQ